MVLGIHNSDYRVYIYIYDRDIAYDVKESRRASRRKKGGCVHHGIALEIYDFDFSAIPIFFYHIFCLLSRVCI